MGKGAEAGPEEGGLGSGEGRVEEAEGGKGLGGKGGEEWKLLGTVSPSLSISGVLFNRDCPIKHLVPADRKGGWEKSD